jgi:hypothetical protein
MEQGVFEKMTDLEDMVKKGDRDDLFDKVFYTAEELHDMLNDMVYVTSKKLYDNGDCSLHDYEDVMRVFICMKEIVRELENKGYGNGV